MRKTNLYVNCKYCGTSFRAVPSLLKRGGGKYCSLTCNGKAQRKPSGKGNWSQKNRGILQGWASRVIKRDGKRCKMCGSVDKLEAHHIVPIRESKAFALLAMNGVTLCHNCHNQVDPDRNKRKSEKEELWSFCKAKSKKHSISKEYCIKSIPEEFHSYPTCGNWGITENGDILVFVTDLGNPHAEFMVGMHELTEAMLCYTRGIKDKDVTKFDVEYERTRPNGIAPCGCTHIPEPGEDIHAPYWKEHQTATNIERILCSELGINWQSYNEGEE